ncbi:MAG: glucose-6-phosphate dehydrogenase [Planctomycetia bacterium]|nr:glucose-6-phosphate dehydrogenase [Planctomycetia bacterium]RLT12319.1 MAG: glucose-6-phosphate dehydrogenase [Planctomycetota bacterium]
MQNTIVIFGASGDLTSRKLVPALYNLMRTGALPPATRIVGFSRTAMSDDAWRASLRQTTMQHAGAVPFSEESWDHFATSIFYEPGDIDSFDDVARLKERLFSLEGTRETTRVYYLATAPQFYGPIVSVLRSLGMSDESQGPRRIVVEKPFGTDLATARALNVHLHAAFHESQIYRIDHYLGKESVQNILALRFANTIFEPIWNRRYIDHVQITVAEEVAVGRRGAYYESSGVLRDMFQNHLLQLLMVTAMEAPVRFRATAVRDEKVKVLEAIRTLDLQEVAAAGMRGQYEGYLSEPGVAPGSQMATFGAIRLEIDNWRWQGVPFYLRSGKVMSCRTTQIVIAFRQPPLELFAEGSKIQGEANRLVIQIQPAEGIQLHFHTKVPGDGMRLRLTDLEFSYSREFKGRLPEAYEPLLLDVLTGDASLFARSDEVEKSWEIIDPFVRAWTSPDMRPIDRYEPGNWGPLSSSDWMESQGRTWFDMCPVLT